MNTNLVIYIIGGLITWRLANMISKQNGPLAIFARLRAFLASKQKNSGGLFDIITCTSCITMIMGLVTSLALVGATSSWFLYTLSFSAIATLTEALIKNKKV